MTLPDAALWVRRAPEVEQREIDSVDDKALVARI